ncbi:unnamed protein product [Schistosoma turkestanicum]|nr:unnamed protein product [Schistosoma turkestanicum]
MSSCIVNSQANNCIELSPPCYNKNYLSSNDQHMTKFRDSTCMVNGVHSLSPLNSAYPNTSVIINPGQLDSRVRSKHFESFTDNSGNGESGSGLSATSGLGSTAIGSGSAKYPGYRHPDDVHAVNGPTHGSDSSNCSNVHMNILMHRNNHTSSPYFTTSTEHQLQQQQQQQQQSISKSVLMPCNTSCSPTSSSSSSSNSKHGIITKELNCNSGYSNNFITNNINNNNENLSKSFQYVIPENILSNNNNSMQLSSLYGRYGELPQQQQQQHPHHHHQQQQQRSTNSIVVCNPITSNNANFQEFSMLSTPTYDHCFSESNFT